MEQPQKSPLTSSQWSLIILILALAAGSVMYRLIVWKRLEQTSLLFIGIPTVLATFLAVSPQAKTTLGGIMRGITLFLLLSGVLLGEGFICIVMAAPLFYAVGALVGMLVGPGRKGLDSTTRSCVILLLLPMSLEGLSPALSFNRDETVQVSQVVDASAEQVRQALGSVPRTDVRSALYLRMGFPHPVRLRGAA